MRHTAHGRSATYQKYLYPFEAGTVYHFYNRSNAKEVIFPDEESSGQFLELFRKYLGEYLDVYAYCLIPNHFHFIVRIKPQDDIQKILSEKLVSDLTKTQVLFLQGESNVDVNELISRQLSNCFNSYSKSFNYHYKRKGNLFNRRINRVEIGDEEHLKYAIYYVHSNPSHHGVLSDFFKYRWSSIYEVVNDRSEYASLSHLYEIFGGFKSLISHHCRTQNLLKLDNLIIEDNPWKVERKDKEVA